MRAKNEFVPYRYKYSDPTQAVEHPTKFALGRSWEWFAHRDTFFNTKFLPERTAVEDWERENVYGATFPKWETPVQSFLKPMVYKSTQRNPILGSLGMAAVGFMFGASPSARATGSVIGGAIGLGAGLFGQGYEKAMGKRYIPAERRKQIALEEYTDILSYTKAAVNTSRALQSGNQQAAEYFAQQAQRTMYGANLDTQTPEQLAMAIPKRKREHFRSMLYAPPQEREQILSTAGRLERRLLQASWGMRVEQKPDLEKYFQEHELPPPESEIWSPTLNMDTIKIKVGQSIGIDMSQMGFYPQQIKEANLINPSYPQFNLESSHHRVRAQIEKLLHARQINADVRAIQTPFPGSRLELNAGVY
jgi:hypothetical protein